MIAQKRDERTRKYSPYELPEGVKLMGELDEVIPCASCSKKILFGEGYTSKTIHTSIGLGYPVCERCYAKERELRKQYPHD